MPLLLAIILQVAGVTGVSVGAGFWFGWPAALTVVSGAVLYVGLEGEKT